MRASHNAYGWKASGQCLHLKCKLLSLQVSQTLRWVCCKVMRRSGQPYSN